MTVSQLTLYNAALSHIGERKIASLSEDQEARYYLDDEYAPALLYCLRQGYWNFAMRAIQQDADVTAPNFGYAYSFLKPSDWIKTYKVSTGEFFDPPLRDYKDQGGYWLASVTPLYFMFVSTTNGVTPASFPQDYAEYVGAYLAQRIYKRITQKSEAEYQAFVKGTVEKLLKIAQANDAMDGAPETMPLGSWTTSRSRRGGQSLWPFAY